MTDQKIGPLFKWFGSKWQAQAARRYPAPQHERIIEPYAGGAGYSLNHCDRQVSIWDEDPLLQELWGWLLRDATSDSVRDIPVGLPTGTVITSLGLSRGQQLLLKNWQRTNNVGNCWTTSSWGSLPGQWTEHTRSRVAEEIHAVKHWKLNDALKSATWATIQAATWFIDPPYLYNYRYSRTLPKFDFDALAERVRGIGGDSLVIVCEALDKKTGYIPGYLPFRPSHNSVTSRRKSTQSHHSREAIYVRHVRIGGT